MDALQEQGNLSVGGSALLMCANPNKTPAEVEAFLTTTMPTLQTPVQIEQARAEGWVFLSLGGNHRGEAHRRFLAMGKLEWSSIRALVISSIPPKFKNIIRGVRSFVH
jgi:hypothetical protein